MKGVNQSKARREAAQFDRDSRNAHRPTAIVKQGSLKPFKRASALFTAIVECRAKYQDDLFTLQQALAAFPPYVSRGHGWKGRIKNRQIGSKWSTDRSKWASHQNHKECARRVIQALPADRRQLAREIGAQFFDANGNFYIPEEQDRRELEVGL